MLNRPRHLRCGTCLYFDGSTGYVGLCRKGLPAARHHRLGQWPEVHCNKDWCGEHVPDDTGEKGDVERG